MAKTSLNLQELISASTTPDLALAVVLLYGLASEAERNDLTHGTLRRFFCPTKAEAKRTVVPLPFELIRLLITNCTFSSLRIPSKRFNWETKDGSRTVFHGSGASATNREKLTRGCPGDRIMIRGRGYIIIDCRICETTVSPFGDVTVVPERYVTR